MSESNEAQIRVEHACVVVRGRHKADEAYGAVERTQLQLTESPRRADVLFFDDVAVKTNPLLRQQLINASKPGGNRVVVPCLGEREEHYELVRCLNKWGRTITRELRETLAAKSRHYLGVAA